MKIAEILRRPGIEWSNEEKQLVFDDLARNTEQIVRSAYSALRRHFDAATVQDAEDVTSWAFEQAFKKIDTYDPNKAHFNRFYGWVKKIAWNQGLRVGKKLASQRERERRRAQDGDFPRAVAPETQSRFPEQGILELIAKAPLSELEGKVFRMRKLEEAEYSAIALNCGISPSNARQIVCRALRKIRETVKQEDSVDG